MLTERAVVISYQSGIAQVKCQSQSACGSCAAKSACGSAALAELNGVGTAHIFEVETITPLNIGQIIEIGLSERSLIHSSLLVYFFPLIILVLSALIADTLWRTELPQGIFIIFCTALAFIIVHLVSKSWQKKTSYRPIFLRVIK
ncbi:SoxR reducing system RseC family protein [Avibacterium sp. 20-15]|uniref:SoxR reducing system RseC family protein n=1 Tax=unclassified Avibacterium TaxID=2685287 RepID=UPI0020264FB1|nr:MULTISPECIES: SoxR reducing system RseC family protein [unclassified Avibacterium]MCW9732715.1 SoxR reducing system RseC family protein [Avibacterium sp. 20-15]URL04862.1 SoxR reducing system RseC family protein [Avibacterium sp. 20-132]